MAIINVSFQLNGKTHYASGESSYPTKEMDEKKEVSDEILNDTAFIFIKQYMNNNSLTGPVDPKTVTYTYVV